LKTFTITLSDNDMSKMLAEKSINSSIQYGYEASIFEAHSGQKAVDYLQSENIYSISNIEYPNYLLYNNWTSVPGTIGCFASHFNLWNICIELNEDIVILEHDAVIVSEWMHPKWKDILHLDWEGSLRRRSMRGVQDKYFPVINNCVYRMGFSPAETPEIFSMNCTYAYAITPSAALKLITDAQKNGWFAADRFIREPVVEIFTINPKLAEEQPEAVIINTTSF